MCLLYLTSSDVPLESNFLLLFSFFFVDLNLLDVVVGLLLLDDVVNHCNLFFVDDVVDDDVYIISLPCCCSTLPFFDLVDVDVACPECWPSRCNLHDREGCIRMLEKQSRCQSWWRPTARCWASRWQCLWWTPCWTCSRWIFVELLVLDDSPVEPLFLNGLLNSCWRHGRENCSCWWWAWRRWTVWWRSWWLFSLKIALADEPVVHNYLAMNSLAMTLLWWTCCKMLVVDVADQKPALTDDVDEPENCSMLSIHCSDKHE